MTSTDQPTTPDGCGHCGEPRPHGWQYLGGVGLHQWQAPTDAQRLERMQARRAARTAAKVALLDPGMVARATATARQLIQQFEEA